MVNDHIHGLAMGKIATTRQFDETAFLLRWSVVDTNHECSFRLPIQYILARPAFDHARTFLSSSCSLFSAQIRRSLMKCATIRCYMHGLPYLVYKGRHLHPSRRRTILAHMQNDLAGSNRTVGDHALIRNMRLAPLTRSAMKFALILQPCLLMPVSNHFHLSAGIPL